MEQDYDINVFINCPYDKRYRQLRRTIIFAVTMCGFRPWLVSMDQDGGRVRMEKILGMIRKSKYGIHDLCRYKAQSKGEIYRLNMPFEFGLDLGCKVYAEGFAEKKMLLLVEKQYTHQPALSDASGYDPKSHNNNSDILIDIIRNFFFQEVTPDKQNNFVRSCTIKEAFLSFQSTLYMENGAIQKEIDNMSDLEYYAKANYFIANKFTAA